MAHSPGRYMGAWDKFAFDKLVHFGNESTITVLCHCYFLGGTSRLVLYLHIVLEIRKLTLKMW